MKYRTSAKFEFQITMKIATQSPKHGIGYSFINYSSLFIWNSNLTEHLVFLFKSGNPKWGKWSRAEKWGLGWESDSGQPAPSHTQWGGFLTGKKSSKLSQEKNFTMHGVRLPCKVVMGSHQGEMTKIWTELGDKEKAWKENPVWREVQIFVMSKYVP